MWILVAFAFCCANIRLSFVYETAAMNQTTNFCFPRSSGSLFFSGLLNLRGPKPKPKMPYYHFNGKWGHAWQSDLRQRPPNMWGKCFLTLFCFFAPFWNLKVRPIFPHIKNMSQKTLLPLRGKHLVYCVKSREAWRLSVCQTKTARRD